MDFLTELRAQIDALDSDIKRLLDKRFEISVKVGALKRGTSAAVYDPVREREILQSIKHDNTLCHSVSVAAVYEAIMDASKKLQG